MSREKNAATAQVAEFATETAAALGLSHRYWAEETIVIDDYIGEAYGVVNESVARAIGTVARTEGIMLDPVYTGKAMAGIIDLLEKGYFEGSSGVVFLRTRGRPALFAHEEELLKYLEPAR